MKMMANNWSIPNEISKFTPEKSNMGLLQRKCQRKRATSKSGGQYIDVLTHDKNMLF
jgi:hypothetical protein